MKREGGEMVVQSLAIFSGLFFIGEKRIATSIKRVVPGEATYRATFDRSIPRYNDFQATSDVEAIGIGMQWIGKVLAQHMAEEREERTNGK